MVVEGVVVEGVEVGGGDSGGCGNLGFCLQDLTLKVSGRDFNFELSYKGSLIK